jgi:NCS2 family nucleobase:cation symporter-2
MHRPVDVAYGLNDRLPLPVLVGAALQQATIVVVLIYPAILLAREVGATPAEAAALLGISLVVAAASTAMQSYGRHGIGCGFQAPGCASAIFIAPALLAARMGGLPLVAGMTMVAGLATVLLARLLPRLRALLPPETAGVVAFLVGLAVSLTAVRTLARTPEPGAIATMLATLAVAVGFSVWGKGMLRWTCVLSALVVGTLVAATLGLVTVPEGFALGSVPMVGLPSLGTTGWAFDATLLPLFLVVALAASLKTIGLVTTLQRANDAEWTRPEPRSIAGGVTAEGLTMVLSGALGALPAQTMGATNVTVQAATGITARYVGFVVAAICLVLACFPRAAAALALVPGPVLAGILLQTGGLMLVNGMQVATSRLIDSRRAAAIGLALAAAIGVEAVPALVEAAPGWLRPMLSATAVGTVLALALNAVLRMGTRRTVAMTVPKGEVPHEELADFVTRAGRAWGARPDVIARTADLTAWCVDAIVGHGLAEGEVTVTLGFDEFRIDLGIAYRGRPLELVAAAPSADELLDDEDGAAKLAGYMIRRRATRASVRTREDATRLDIVLDH